jgi:hypothetical protein
MPPREEAAPPEAAAEKPGKPSKAAKAARR